MQLKSICKAIYLQFRKYQYICQVIRAITLFYFSLCSYIRYFIVFYVFIGKPISWQTSNRQISSQICLIYLTIWQSEMMLWCFIVYMALLSRFKVILSCRFYKCSIIYIGPQHNGKCTQYVIYFSKVIPCSWYLNKHFMWKHML